MDILKSKLNPHPNNKCDGDLTKNPVKLLAVLGVPLREMC